MSWIKRKTLPTIKSILYEGQPCNTLPNLWHAIYLSYNSAKNRLINASFLNKIPQADQLLWPSFLKQEFKDAIAKCLSSSTPGPDHISWRYLKSLIANDKCLLKITQIANACIDLEFWPSHFKSSNTVVIPKPNKNNYNFPKSFCPIVLLNTTGKLIEKVISNRLQFYLLANSFLDSHQFGDICQWSTTDAGIYLTYLIRMGWLRQCHMSVLVFDIAQFFPSLNYQFLSLCLKKAGLNTNVIYFFNSYHSDHYTSYLWNSFTSPSFNINVSIGQGSALSPILSALYLVPIIKTFKKRIKNLNKEILTDILSFVDDGLLISQEKSYFLSNSLLCSYNIISKILINASLIMEHNKTEIFYFTRARHPPNLSIDLTSVGGPIINPKPIWRYLGFFFNWKLNFHYHTHFYATKCLSTLNAMKMLGNFSQGLLPMQKRLLYRTYILSIVMYGFNLWFFKGALIVKNVNELKKMQCKAALWITGAFWTSPSDGIKAIAGLIPITLHMHKLNGRHHLRYSSIPSLYAINSLLDSQHAKNHPPYKATTSKLTNKQWSSLKSPIKDVNECLNGIRDCYNLLFPLFSPGSRVVDHFSSRFSFHSSSSSSDEDLFHHLQNLDQAFRSSQITSPL